MRGWCRTGSRAWAVGWRLAANDRECVCWLLQPTRRFCLSCPPAEGLPERIQAGVPERLLAVRSEQDRAVGGLHDLARGPGAGALPPAWGPGSARAGPHRKNDADLAGRRPGQVAHPAGDVDRMIAEPVIEPRYQRHLDRHRGLHPA